MCQGSMHASSTALDMAALLLHCCIAAVWEAVAGDPVGCSS